MEKEKVSALKLARDVLERYRKLDAEDKKRYDEYEPKGRVPVICPAHEEKTPSCMVDIEKKRFHCFSCGAEGSLELVM